MDQQDHEVAHPGNSNNTSQAAVFRPISNSPWTGSGQQPIRVTVVYTTGSGLAALGVQPRLGRLFNESEDYPGTPQTLLLSNFLWKQAFGADPNIIGREIYLDSAKCTIIGVMPPGFVFPPGEIDPPQAWSSLQLDPSSRAFGSHFLSVFARLHSGLRNRFSAESNCDFLSHRCFFSCHAGASV
jgi:hypothetical protein